MKVSLKKLIQDNFGGSGWRKEQVEPDYFGRYVYPLVESKLGNEFTIEDLILKSELQTTLVHLSM
jgi:hypothetical protein